jgi:hypothetical protein
MENLLNVARTAHPENQLNSVLDILRRPGIVSHGVAW